MLLKPYSTAYLSGSSDKAYLKTMNKRLIIVFNQVY